MAKLLTRCPVCDSALGVTELTCGHCHTSIRGSFATCRFCRLSTEHLSFVEIFLRNEGNLSRVGSALGLSYPTVRNKLGAALIALGLDVPEESIGVVPISELRTDGLAAVSADGRQGVMVAPPSAEMLEQRRLVLQSLSDGSLSVEEAAEALRDL